jgi:hypothetical protein
MGSQKLKFLQHMKRLPFGTGLMFTLYPYSKGAIATLSVRFDVTAAKVADITTGCK